MKTLQEKTVELSHRAALVEAATAVLNEYTPFKSHHRVTFHTDDTQPTDRKSTRLNSSHRL